MRNRIDFWLDDTRADDKRVLKRVQSLKSKKSFRKTVMDGIMVMSQLAKGDTTLLFKLHPWIIDKVLASAPPTPAAPSTPDSGDLDQRISAAVTAGVQVAILNMPSLPATPLVGAPLKPASAPPKVETKAAPLADANAIADNFMAFTFQ